VVAMKVIVMWDVLPCSLVEVYWCFRGLCVVCTARAVRRWKTRQRGTLQRHVTVGPKWYKIYKIDFYWWRDMVFSIWASHKAAECSVAEPKKIIHKEFLPEGQTVNSDYYLRVLNRLWARILRIWPEYREQRSWSLLHPTIIRICKNLAVSTIWNTADVWGDKTLNTHFCSCILWYCLIQARKAHGKCKLVWWGVHSTVDNILWHVT
jgi:hypothetical protein